MPERIITSDPEYPPISWRDPENPEKIMLKVSDENGNLLQEFDAEQIKSTQIKDITKATTPFDFEGRLKRWCYKIIKPL